MAAAPETGGGAPSWSVPGRRGAGASHGHALSASWGHAPLSLSSATALRRLAGWGGPRREGASPPASEARAPAALAAACGELQVMNQQLGLCVWAPHPVLLPHSVLLPRPARPRPCRALGRCTGRWGRASSAPRGGGQRPRAGGDPGARAPACAPWVLPPGRCAAPRPPRHPHRLGEGHSPLPAGWGQAGCAPSRLPAADVDPRPGLAAAAPAAPLTLAVRRCSGGRGASARWSGTPRRLPRPPRRAPGSCDSQSRE